MDADGRPLRVVSDPAADASWRTAGWVVIDSGTVLLGDPQAFLAWRDSGADMPDEYVLDDKIVFFVTMDDLDCPVEKGYVGDDVIAIRVELFNDVADTAGGWDVVGELVLGRPSCLVADPCWSPADDDRQLLAGSPTEDTDLRAESGVVVGCVLSIPIGRYLVEVFRSKEQDSLGVRLRRSRA